MKKGMIGALLLTPLILLAGGNPGNPLRKFTVEDSVRWVLSGVELAYNERVLEGVLMRFSQNYSDANGASFSTLSIIIGQLLQAEENIVEGDRFLMYNASALVNGDQALLTATILIQPPGSNEGANLLVANDTITLQRAGDSWLITSAPHLVEKLEEAAGLEVLPPRSTRPIQEHTDEYELPDAESTQGGNDVQ